MHYIDIFNPTTYCFCMGIKPNEETEPHEQYFEKLKEGFICQIKWQKVNTFFFLLKDYADIDLVNALQDVNMRLFNKSLIVGIFSEEFKNNLNEEYKEKYDKIATSCDVKIDLRRPYTKEREQKIIKSLIDLCPHCILTYSESNNPIIEEMINYIETKEIRLLLL